MLAAEIQFAYSFLTGAVSAINPCGFVLLPTYLMFFLGVEGNRPGTQRAAIGRALRVSAMVSIGFISVFLIIGAITRLLTDWVQNEAADYLSMIIGVLMVVVGIAMLFGKYVPLMMPKLDAGGRDTTARSMFLYGVSYALASIGCTIGLFAGVILGRFDETGFVGGVLSIGAYGLGMALILSALTVSLALARTGMLRLLRRVMSRIDLISGVVMALAGLYLFWYGYTALTDRSSAVTDEAFGIQSRLQNWLNDIGATQLFLVLGGLTLAAVVAVVGLRWRERRAAPADPTFRAGCAGEFRQAIGPAPTVREPAPNDSATLEAPSQAEPEARGPA